MTKGERTRRRLLDATAAEVARHGVAGTSVNRIAAAAGLKSASVFFHFPTKDALVDAMLEYGLRETLRHLDTALSGVDGPAEEIRAAIRAHVTAVHELPDHTRAVLDPTVDGSATFRVLRRRYVQRWTALVSAAQRAGVIGSGPDPRLLRDLLFGALNAVGLTGRKPAEAAAALETLLGLSRPSGDSVDHDPGQLTDQLRPGRDRRSEDPLR